MGKKSGERNIFEEIMAKFSDQRHLTNPVTRNMNKTTPNHIINKFLKSNEKGKILKAEREEKTLCVENQW